MIRFVPLTETQDVSNSGLYFGQGSLLSFGVKKTFDTERTYTPYRIYGHRDMWSNRLYGQCSLGPNWVPYDKSG